MACITWPIFEIIEVFLTLPEQRILAGISYFLWLSFTMREDFPARRQRQILGNGGGRMVRRMKTKTVRAPCLSVLRACTAAKRSTRNQAANAVNPCDGVTKGCSSTNSPLCSTDSSWSINPTCGNESSSSQAEEHNVESMLLHSFCTLRSQSTATVLLARRGNYVK